MQKIIGAVVTVALVYFGNLFVRLFRNIQAAKKSGLNYRILPFVCVEGGDIWTAVSALVLPPLYKGSLTKHWDWPKLLDPFASWHFHRELYDKLGDSFILVSPSMLYLATTNADVITQIAGRRHDFEKPIELYSVVDQFGPSVLTTDGSEWKRHRKIVAPAFSEKSNALVWEESLKQAQSMLDTWSKHKSNSVDDIQVDDTGDDAQYLTLNVICGAGFGVPQIWPGEDEKRLGKKIVPGFNTTELLQNHSLTFRESLHVMLSNILWLAVLPRWMLESSPFKVHKSLSKAYNETADYFEELSVYKSNQMANDQTEEGIMDLMGPLIKAAEHDGPDPNSKNSSSYLTKQEVIADSWIFLFAGHETSAGTLHFAFAFLATDLEAQKALRQDIDKVVGSRPASEWTYASDMKNLYNSMVGAVQNETLRLMPPVANIPKTTREQEKVLTLGEKEVILPPRTFVHLNVIGVQRNPKYYPHRPSKLTNAKTDLDDFVPSRWIIDTPNTKPTISAVAPAKTSANGKSNNVDGLESASFDVSSDSPLFTPVKGGYIPFSEGARACPGRRFAQVEITAVLALIFQAYTVELDVRAWASDKEVDGMDMREKKKIYGLAKDKARMLLRTSEQIITLRMSENLPVRFVKRGRERFTGC